MSRGVIRGGCSAQIFSCLQRNFSLSPPLPSEKENERVTCHSVTGATSSPLPRHPPASAGPNPSAPVRPARLPLAPELCCPTCSARTAGFTAAGLKARAAAAPGARVRPLSPKTVGVCITPSSQDAACSAALFSQHPQTAASLFASLATLMDLRPHCPEPPARVGLCESFASFAWIDGGCSGC